jgi:hypothetical protein
MAFDPHEFRRRLAETNADLRCLWCGSIDLHVSDARYALIELDPNDHLDIEWGMASAIFCGALICDACGHIHLHSLKALSEEGPL